jgi:hypothetical protein
VMKCRLHCNKMATCICRFVYICGSDRQSAWSRATALVSISSSYGMGITFGCTRLHLIYPNSKPTYMATSDSKILPSVSYVWRFKQCFLACRKHHHYFAQLPCIPGHTELQLTSSTELQTAWLQLVTNISTILDFFLLF